VNLKSEVGVGDDARWPLHLTYEVGRVPLYTPERAWTLMRTAATIVQETLADSLMSPKIACQPVAIEFGGRTVGAPGVDYATPMRPDLA
jgi:hypothetical protein